MEKRKIEYEIAEICYKPDIELLTKYQEFSTELARIAVLLLAGYGFVLGSIGVHNGQPTKWFSRLVSQPWLAGTAIGAVCVTIAAALAHRYLSSDAFAYQLSYFRAVAKCRANGDDARLASLANSEYQGFLQCLKRSSTCLWLASVSLALAAITTAVVLGTALLC